MAWDQSTESAGRLDLAVVPDRRPLVASGDPETNCLLLIVAPEERLLRRMRAPVYRQGECGIANACVSSFRIAYCCGLQANLELQTGRNNKPNGRGESNVCQTRRLTKRPEVRFSVVLVRVMVGAGAVRSVISGNGLIASPNPNV